MSSAGSGSDEITDIFVSIVRSCLFNVSLFMPKIGNAAVLPQDVFWRWFSE